MYKRSNSILISSDVDPTRYIEVTDVAGSDLANSTLLYLLDKEIDLASYTITKYEHRIDLISNDIYGSNSYSWLLLYLNRVSLSELVRGFKLNYIEYSRLQYLLSSI